MQPSEEEEENPMMQKEIMRPLLVDSTIKQQPCIRLLEEEE